MLLILSLALKCVNAALGRFAANSFEIRKNSEALTGGNNFEPTRNSKANRQKAPSTDAKTAE